MYQSAECLTCGYYKLWEEDWTRKLSTDHQQEEEDWQTSGLHIQEVQAVKGTKTACWIIEFIWYQCFNFLYLDFLHQKLLEIHFEKDTIQRTTKNLEYHHLGSHNLWLCHDCQARTGHVKAMIPLLTGIKIFQVIFTCYFPSLLII